MIKLIKHLIKVLFTFDKTPKEALQEIHQGHSIPTRSSKQLIDAEPKLQDAFRLIRLYYRNSVPGHTLVLTEVFRHPKKQKALYAQGRTKPGKKVTYVDGHKKKGKHNYYPSKAIDVAVLNIHTNKITWDVKKYKPLVKLATRVSKEIGVKITSGGSWKKLKDYPHLQV